MKNFYYMLGLACGTGLGTAAGHFIMSLLGKNNYTPAECLGVGALAFLLVFIIYPLVSWIFKFNKQ